MKERLVLFLLVCGVVVGCGSRQPEAQHGAVANDGHGGVRPDLKMEWNSTHSLVFEVGSGPESYSGRENLFYVKASDRGTAPWLDGFLIVRRQVVLRHGKQCKLELSVMSSNSGIVEDIQVGEDKHSRIISPSELLEAEIHTVVGGLDVVLKPREFRIEPDSNPDLITRSSEPVIREGWLAVKIQEKQPSKH